MDISTMRLPVMVFVTGILVLNAAKANTAESAELILPTDPRFSVFELSNSAGDGTFASPLGTVVVSLLAEDGRYCRAARFPGESRQLLPENGRIETASPVFREKLSRFSLAAAKTDGRYRQQRVFLKAKRELRRPLATT